MTGFAGRIVARLKAASLGDVLIRRFPPLYRRYRRELADFEASDIAARRVAQERLLARALQRAGGLAAYSAFQGRPLSAYPLLAKERLRTSPQDFLGPLQVLAASAATSGSSGMPLAVKRSFASLVFEQAAIDHVAALAGADFRHGRVAILRGEAIKDASDMTPPYWRMQGGGRVMNFSASHLGEQSAPAYFEALQQFRPDVLWAYPSALETLAGHFRALSLQLSIPVILTSSEVLTDDVRQQAATTFGARVADYYGQAERVSFAYSLEAGAYRFLSPYGHVELLPLEDGGAGFTRCSIVSTNLRNSAQPLVRYRTGDVALIEGEASDGRLEAISLGAEPFLRIEGREADYLVAPDGRRLIGMNHVPRGIEGVVQMQLRQVARDRVLVLAVANGSGGPELEREIAGKLAARLPGTMRIDVEFRDRLERNASGKLPLVVRETD
ncbi:AMP-binding protein [Stappia sp. F7233]|uniref:AMP-binding protein n=1 Tax=Stappia albiluteola TaxID=2758565 RepID=A0A839AB43_9HYPH|nr:AMP-binding protein [Stappia albiluteola]MBA5775939.1 AMP-binding protein [Stappia albiluteola]